MLGAVLTFDMDSLILTAILYGRYSHYPHFIDGEIEE